MTTTKIPAELVAVNAIQGTLIADNAITSVHIAQNNITTTQIATNNITSEAIAQNNVTAVHILQNTITVTHLADSAVENAKIGADAVTGAKLADNAVDSEHYTDGSIDTAHLGDLSVTAAKLGANAVTLAKMASLARGSILIGNSAADVAALAIGSANKILTSDGTDVIWSALNSGIDDNSNAVAMTIDSSERVGIGTTSPNAPLTVAGEAYFKTTVANNEENRFYFEVGGSGNNGILHIYNNAAAEKIRLNTGADSYFMGGNIGIGTTSPTEKVQVNGAIRSTNNAANTPGVADSGVFYFIPTADDGSNPRTVVSGVGTASVGAHVTFKTGTTSSNTEKMRIDTSGNVGIGITTPNESGFGATSNVLSIAGTAQDAFGVLELISTDVTSSNRIGEIRFGNLDAGSSFASNAGIRATRDGADNSSALSLWTTNAGTFAEHLTISAAGNATFSGTLTIPSSIIHTGDTDTSIAFDTNTINLTTGNVAGLQIVSGVNYMAGTPTLPSGSSERSYIYHNNVSNTSLHIGNQYEHASAAIHFETQNTKKMTIDGAGVLWLKGGTTTGVQDLAFQNSYHELADNAALTISSARNTGCLIAVGSYLNGAAGITYNHGLFFGDYGSNHAMVEIADPSGTFGVSSGTDNLINVVVSGNSDIVIENKSGATNRLSVALFRFLGL
jgi:hypothetical protein